MIREKIIKHQHLLSQLMRFTLVGISSSIVHFSTVITLVELKWLSPLKANVIAFLVAFSVSYLGHRFWTFDNTTQRFHQSLPRFLMVASASFLLNESFFWVLLNKAQLDYALALFIVLSSVSLLTFTLSKCWAFHSRGSQPL